MIVYGVAIIMNSRIVYDGTPEGFKYIYMGDRHGLHMHVTVSKKNWLNRYKNGS